MAETSSSTPIATSRNTSVAARVGQAARLAFSLWLFLSLTTSSWRYGPFSWWPLWRGDEVAGGPLALGALNLLLLLAIVGWLARRLLARDWHWSWGPAAITVPFLALSGLGLATLTPLFDRLTFITVGALFLTWLVYLAVLNERPALLLTLAAIVLVQSSVALGQFLLQRDLGLAQWGELPLRPFWQGISVLSAGGRPWLRAYGLVAHPNLLGALLTVLLLLLLPAARAAGGMVASFLLQPLFAIGLLGLLASFSRASWLGMAAGLLFALLSQRRPRERSSRLPARHWLWLLLPLLLFVILYHDLVLSRLLALDTPLEARSIGERLRDARLALALIARAPWSGVGLGRYADTAVLINPAAGRVHNATLLVTAEMGFPGLILWLMLALGPFWLVWRGRLDAAALPPWLAMLVINLFDTTLWWSSNWQTAILFGLLLACLARHTLDSAAQERNRQRFALE